MADMWRQKYKNLNRTLLVLENKKSFLDEIKHIFIVFEGLSFCEK